MLKIKRQFGIELKERVLKKQDFENIGSWAYKYYMQNMLYIDTNFRDTLITLTMMEGGEEFQYTYSELEKIADDLIDGKDIRLL